ncbi:hypothetical protein AMTR_s00104p00070050 [Amborella trichopoda]|uniref:Enoyl reductase (ER) domain-containing protein n=1 Tax=Amborella trichopoda TaxID=13333 RepID=W1NYG8_AMBTC|nr:hypothetical protein AMTR_s00104p00070050 [Amborella trichopoda]
MEVGNRYVSLKKYINGAPCESDLEIKTAALSLEPRKGSGDIIDAPGVGEVVASDIADYNKGDWVADHIGWQEYSVIHGGETMRKIETKEFPLSHHAGILGLSGFTAYVGFHHVCKPKKGDRVFVSAAAGSVGSLVGQYAKLAGCYTVGCVGSKKKVDMLKDKIGFDDAFNYRDEPDLKAALKRHFPDGIDIYFDNVGGEMLEAAVANMNCFGRIGICGAISDYTNSIRTGTFDTVDTIDKRITIQGFLVVDYVHIYKEFLKATVDYLHRGEIHAVEDISQGLESVPAAFVGLFHGDNTGRKLVQVIHH